jgi:hypothetical protein
VFLLDNDKYDDTYFRKENQYQQQLQKRFSIGRPRKNIENLYIN